jgi:hypothetical protein
MDVVEMGEEQHQEQLGAPELPQRGGRVGEEKEEEGDEERRNVLFAELIDGLCSKEEVQDCHVLDLPLSAKQKLILAAENPVATSRLFIALMEVFFELLLGLQLTERSKKTYPRADESVLLPSSGNVDVDYGGAVGAAGAAVVDEEEGARDPARVVYLTKLEKVKQAKYKEMFPSNILQKGAPPLGQAHSAIAVIEEQKKQTLHAHAIVYLAFKPETVQNLADHPFLRQVMCNVMDSVITTMVPAHLHVKQALLHHMGKQPNDHSTGRIPPAVTTIPVRTETNGEEVRRAQRMQQADLLEVRNFAYQTTATTGIHVHQLPTCQSKQPLPPGVTNTCRFANPQPLSEATQYIQLKKPEEEAEEEAREVARNVGFMLLREPEARETNTTHRWRRQHSGENRGLVVQDSRAIILRTSRPILHLAVDSVAGGTAAAAGGGDPSSTTFNLFRHLLEAPNDESFLDWKIAINREFCRVVAVLLKEQLDW